MKTSIYSYNLEDLTKIRLARGQSSYRSKQIYSWLAKDFREKLK